MNKEILLFILDKHKQGATTKQIIGLVSDKFGVDMKYRYMRRIITGERGIILRRQLEKEGYNFDNAETTSNDVNLVIDKNGNQTHTTVIEMRDGQEKDPEYLLVAHGYNPDEWEITNAVSNFWQQGSAEHGTKDLYQSKITVKPKIKNVGVEGLIKVLNGGVNSITIENKNSGQRSLVISLFDLHFGITTIEMLESHLHQMANIIKNGYKRVEIIVGGDVLHSDFMTKTQTASNTQLDHVDTIKSLYDAETFIGTLIELSLENAPIVEVKAVSGNHDADSQYLFMWGLSKKYPQVSFDNRLNSTRLAFSFGKIGIMVAHGNLALKRLPMLFANEYNQIWANSTYRMVASGHFHTEKKSDMDGVMMYQFGTAKPNDPYEQANGYTMARKHLQLLEFDDERLLATYEVE